MYPYRHPDGRLIGHFVYDENADQVVTITHETDVPISGMKWAEIVDRAYDDHDEDEEVVAQVIRDAIFEFGGGAT